MKNAMISRGASKNLEYAILTLFKDSDVLKIFGRAKSRNNTIIIEWDGHLINKWCLPDWLEEDFIENPRMELLEIIAYL